MTIRLSNISLPVDAPESLLLRTVATRLSLPVESVAHWVVTRRALDSRRTVRFVYTIDVALADPRDETQAVRDQRAAHVELPVLHDPAPGREELRGRVMVVGAGPAGLFAALFLARKGYHPMLIDRGAAVDKRHADVARFHRDRQFNPNSNVLFGAGGAGTYSDGKLRTRIRDPRIRHVLESFVRAGAPCDILVNARPHIGTDRLLHVVRALCAELIARGGDMAWRTRVTGLRTANNTLMAVETDQGVHETNCVVLATGSNARDTFQSMAASGLAMSPKPFQMGLRIEHPREWVDKRILKQHAGDARCGAAAYALSASGVTSFCVCPGGVIVAAIAEADTVCTNGMSPSDRDGVFTNGALVTTVRPETFGSGPLAGIEYQRHWERAAFRIAGESYAAPAQNAEDFLADRVGALPRPTTYPFGCHAARLRDVIPKTVAEAVGAAMVDFDRRLPGFAGPDAVLVGPETRASCPVRMIRDADRRVSESVDGVYPAGEGSGYASGIMSSAVDGLRTAEAIVARFARPQH